MTRARLLAMLVVGLLAVGIAAPAWAVDEDPDAWHVTVIPYVWAAGLYGDVTVRGLNAELDQSFLDTIEESDLLLGLQGHLLVTRGRIGVFGDLTYVKTKVTDAGATGLDVETRMWFVEFGAQYRLLDTRDERVPGFTLDLYGGGRYTSMELDLDTAGAPSANQSQDWIDPIVGARVGMHLSEHVSLLFSGDVGGFGVGSDFAWSILGLFAYTWRTESVEWSILAGYRALGQDYTTGSGTRRFRWDVTMHGPILGFSARF